MPAHQGFAALGQPDQLAGRQPGQIQPGQRIEGGVDPLHRPHHIIRKHVRILKQAADKNPQPTNHLWINTELWTKTTRATSPSAAAPSA